MTTIRLIRVALFLGILGVALSATDAQAAGACYRCTIDGCALACGGTQGKDGCASSVVCSQGDCVDACGLTGRICYDFKRCYFLTAISPPTNSAATPLVSTALRDDAGSCSADLASQNPTASSGKR